MVLEIATLECCHYYKAVYIKSKDSPKLSDERVRYDSSDEWEKIAQKYKEMDDSCCFMATVFEDVLQVQR